MLLYQEGCKESGRGASKGGRALHLFGFLVTFSRQPIVTKWSTHGKRGRKLSEGHALRASDANHAALNLQTNPGGALHGHGLANRCDSLCFPERVRIQTLQAVSTETRNEPSRSLEPRTEPQDRPTAAVYENSTCVDSPSDRMTPLNHYLKRLNLC
jgi:hypothetical protein